MKAMFWRDGELRVTTNGRVGSSSNYSVTLKTTVSFPDGVKLQMGHGDEVVRKQICY